MPKSFTKNILRQMDYDFPKMEKSSAILHSIDFKDEQRKFHVNFSLNEEMVTKTYTIFGVDQKKEVEEELIKRGGAYPYKANVPQTLISEDKKNHTAEHSSNISYS